MDGWVFIQRKKMTMEDLYIEELTKKLESLAKGRAEVYLNNKLFRSSVSTMFSGEIPSRVTSSRVSSARDHTSKRVILGRYIGCSRGFPLHMLISDWAVSSVGSKLAQQQPDNIVVHEAD